MSVVDPAPDTRPEAADRRGVGTPRYPALVRRRGLFALLLVLYLVVLAGLIAMAVSQHASR